MGENPPYPADTVALDKLRKIGVEQGKTFDIATLDQGLARALERAVKDVQVEIREGVTKMKTVNGWMQPPNLGRYGTDYETRAGVAYMGLGADLQEETIYPTAYADGDGKALDCAAST